MYLSSLAYLKDGLLDSDAHTLAVHTGPRIADETELKVDADLLARALGELMVSASPLSFNG